MADIPISKLIMAAIPMIILAGLIWYVTSDWQRSVTVGLIAFMVLVLFVMR